MSSAVSVYFIYIHIYITSMYQYGLQKKDIKRYALFSIPAIFFQ